MVVSQTEAALAALLVAFVSGVVIPLFRGRKYRTCNDCDKRHADQEAACKSQHDADRKSQQTQYRMLRALVIHSPMTPEEKEKVLNDRGIDRD